MSLHFLAIIFGLSSGLCPTYHSDTPRSEPHPLALFSLIPLNNRAADVIAHPCNSHLVSRLPAGILGLDIGLHMRSKSGNTIATLGRGDTDIFVGGSSIAKTQCSFEIDLDNNVVMLYDRSHGCTTQVFGEDAMPFEHGRIRKIVVQKNLNTTIGMVVKDKTLFNSDCYGTRVPPKRKKRSKIDKAIQMLKRRTLALLAL